MKQNKKLIAMTVIAGLLLPGCGGYQKRSLNIFKQRPANYEQTIDDVTMKISKLTQEECEQVFGRRAQNLTLGQSGINPLVLSITNNSATRWELAENNIGLQLSEPEEVAQRLKLNTALYAGGIFGIGVGISILAGVGLTFASFASAYGIAAAAHPAIIVASWPLVFIGTIISSIPALGYGLYQSPSNQSIKRIARQSTKNATIESGKAFGGLLFVNKPDYTPEFTITLQEKTDHSNSMTFNVNLSNKVAA